VSQRNPEALERIMQAIAATHKYATICHDVVVYVAQEELARRSNLKQAIKSTKNRLHQLGGAYLSRRPDYGSWLERLRGARSQEEQRDACLEMMAHHASTGERIPILDVFYDTILAPIGPIRSVLDVACGLNPLAIHWMPLAADARYIAVDMYEDMTQFFRQALPLFGVSAEAHALDVAHQPLPGPVQLAMVLKTLPCLTQMDRSAARNLLLRLDAEYILVTYPSKSLGRRDKGMVATYTGQFEALVDDTGWAYQRHEFEGELAFLIDRAC